MTRRIIINRAVDNGPTPERVAKGDYETVAGSGEVRRRRSDTLRKLQDSNDIDAEAVEFAWRYIADYDHSVNDYLDIAQDPLPREAERGDVHTWALARGKAGERISLVRELLGVCAHARLQMMLGEGMSFAAMGVRLFPGAGLETYRKKTSHQCAMILMMLPSAYRQAIRKQKERIEKERKRAEEMRLAKMGLTPVPLTA